jgi:hypothetical protein
MTSLTNAELVELNRSRKIYQIAWVTRDLERALSRRHVSPARPVWRLAEIAALLSATAGGRPRLTVEKIETVRCSN